ncbi:Terpene synthase, N-terminal domain [Dillenia turbinata]|uniref:Terpene synthase, N-terminal domain n=1 Tax=Dillenia turbinata TaxID=194707 RepID=A0AAN8Z014_9MAGN
MLVCMKLLLASGSLDSMAVRSRKGVLSLYEAAHAAYEGENILDEAKSFATKHLREVAEDSSTSLAKYINHSLFGEIFNP